jgi:outer membrane lipoprotein-sorting protein
MTKKLFWILAPILLATSPVRAQDITMLVNKVKDKLAVVDNYVAHGTLKTDVTFIKAPVGKITVYYKKPDQFRVEKEKGISILPKGGVSVNISSILATNRYVVVDAGTSNIGSVETKVVKLVPVDDSSDIVLSTLFIDTANLLVLRAITTTRENGTYQIDMTYGKYKNYALPDRVVFSFNTKDYKLPRGVTLEFDENTPATNSQQLAQKKGKIEITYSTYVVNKGIDTAIFRH